MLATGACYAIGRDCLFVPRHALAALLAARAGGPAPPQGDERRPGRTRRRRRSGVRSIDCTHDTGGASSRQWRLGACPHLAAPLDAPMCRAVCLCATQCMRL